MSSWSKRLTATVAVLACAGLGLRYAPSALAAQTVPLTLTQQGRLLDATGAPVDSVALTFKFALYATPTAGTAIWTETQSITPDEGYFSARLGEETPFPATVFDGSQAALYLGIQIGSDSEMAPRQQLTSVPFAMLSLNATHATVADSATSAEGGLNTRIAALETRTSCPEPNAPGNFGFCIWHEGTGYQLNYTNAAKACKAKGGRLCTLAEVSAAQAAGAEWCAYSWVADRTDNNNGYQTFPMAHPLGGCGNSIGLQTGPAAFTSTFDANCCKP
jgi:hypothetical protein